MVYARKRTTKKVFKRRPVRNNRRRRNTGPNSVVSKSSPIPDRFFTKLKYSESRTFSYAGIMPAVYVFRANSIYAPNLTAGPLGGHQPLGHDQFETLYLRYRVYGMSYTMTFSNPSTTDYAEVSVVHRPNNTIMGNQDTVRESPNCIHKLTISPEGSGASTKTVRGYFNIGKVRGVSKKVVALESDYQALMGSSPAIVPTIQIYHYNATTPSVGSPIYMRVDLQYMTCLFDRKTLTQS